jgi:hypothetical protein
MRAYALVLATCLTVLYGYIAHAAMTAARPATVAGASGHAGEAEPVWNGGTLAPVTVSGRAGGTGGAEAVAGAKLVAKEKACVPERARS